MLFSRNFITTASTLVAGLFLSSTAHAAAWTMDSEASSLSIVGIQTNEEFDAEFTTFMADIVLDPEDLSDASIAVTVDTASFSSGATDRDATVDDANWFDIMNFPEATFTASEIEEQADGSYVANGVLAMKGVEAPLSLPFTLAIEDGRAVADGSVTINRLDWNVGTGSDWEDGIFVGLDVVISFHIEADAAQ